MTGWKKYKLGEIVSVLGDGLHGTPQYSIDGEYYFINGNNLSNGKIIIKNETKRVTHAEYLKYKKKLNNRTLFVSINGTIGNYALYNNEKVVLGKSACYFNLKDDVDKRFVSQVMSSKSFRDYLHTNATGTTIKNVSLKSMRDYPIHLPPLPTQHRIAEILGALDDKIELNLQMNKTLEDMAMALYKHWFVDFWPFKEGEFVESELGQIPKGWEVTNYFDVAELLSGGTPKTSIPDYWNGNIKWVSGIDIGNSNGLFLIDTDKKITQKGLENSSTKVLPPYTLILVARGSVGKYGVLATEMAMNQSCYGVYKKNSISQFWLILSMIQKLTLLIQSSHGTVFNTITTNTFKNLKIIKPISSAMDEFEEKSSPLFNQIKQNVIENQTLTQTRDYLLPKLISGEIEVS